MHEIECIALNGSIRRVPASEIVLRPAAYALILHQGRILLLRMKYSGKYHLPGGGVDPAERLTEALAREIREETGLEIEVGPLVHFNELFFYYDPSGQAYHGLHFYYACRAKNPRQPLRHPVSAESSENPHWVHFHGLNPDQFQSAGEAILAYCRDPSFA